MQTNNVLYLATDIIALIQRMESNFLKRVERKKEIKSDSQ